MILKPARARAARHGERLGEAAGLVELDVDGIVAAGEAVESALVCALSSAQIGTGCGNVRERLVGARGQRLLDQLEP